MKITVEQLKEGMLVDIKFRLKDESTEKTIRGLITKVIQHHGQSGRGGMDMGSPTYKSYYVANVLYSDTHDLKININPALRPALVLEGEGTWSPNPYEYLELTYVGVTKPTVVWEYDSNSSVALQQTLEDTFIANIKKKVKGVLTDDELEMLLSMKEK